MARQTYPLTAAGLEVPVWIGLDGATTAALVGAGKPVAPPVRARGLLDTGSSVTAIPSWLIQQLAIPVATTHVTHTAAGPMKVNLCRVSLRLEGAQIPSSSWLMLHDLLVMELVTALPDADVLVGLDVLLTCQLHLDGPGRHFTLDF
jgi:uncharacterized membrane protein YagU involved in acid resistance